MGTENKYFEGCYVTEKRWLEYCKDSRRLRFRGLPVQIILPDDTVISPKEYWKLKDAKKSRWKPKLGEKYYYISDCGEISWRLWANVVMDNYLYSINNIGKTKEELEEKKKKEIYQQQYRDYALEHNEKIDWNNTEQFKYCVFYAHNTSTIVYDAYWSAQPQGAVYFTNKQDIFDFIKLIGEDKFKKYILGVEQ